MTQPASEASAHAPRPPLRGDAEERERRRAEDLALVAETLAGDRTAFEALFAAYRDRVNGVVNGYVRDADDALDLTQDAFVKAFEKLSSFRGQASFFTWITQIGIHLAIDHTRKRKRRRVLQLEDHHLGEPPRSAVHEPRDADRMLSEELHARYEQALEALSDKHRTVFVLHTVKGLAYKEIAAVLDISIGTVMSRLHYARKRIQSLMGDYLNTE